MGGKPGDWRTVTVVGMHKGIPREIEAPLALTKRLERILTAYMRAIFRPCCMGSNQKSVV